MNKRNLLRAAKNRGGAGGGIGMYQDAPDFERFIQADAKDMGALVVRIGKLHARRAPAGGLGAGRPAGGAGLQGGTPTGRFRVLGRLTSTACLTNLICCSCSKSERLVLDL